MDRISAKEKAKELATQHFEELFEYIPNIEYRMKAAKQCALIACAEKKDMVSRNDENAEIVFEYLRELEQEINNL